MAVQFCNILIICIVSGLLRIRKLSARPGPVAGVGISAQTSQTIADRLRAQKEDPKHIWEFKHSNRAIEMP